MRCDKLQELMNEQKIIIERHIAEHAYFQNIEDRSKATVDFIDKFGWVMREAYCDLCSKKKPCEIYQNYLKSNGWQKRL